MARRKLNERGVRKLSRRGSGGSISVTIPVEIIRELKWKSKQKVIVTRKGKSVVINDWVPRKK